MSETKTFSIKSWNTFAFWENDNSKEFCSICRNHVMDLCIDCQSLEVVNKEGECNLTKGKCGHTFHFHCIVRWLKTKKTCPLDNKIWSFHVNHKD